MSHNVVYSVIQDERGFIWLGTQVGLDRFDGYGFKGFQYQPDKEQALSGNNLSALGLDPDGIIWIGTWGDGLLRLDPSTRKFRVFQNRSDEPDSLSEDRIQSLYADSRGAVWVGTFSSGLSRLDVASGVFRHFQMDRGQLEGQAPNRIWSICEDHLGRLWLGTDNGLYQWREEGEELTRFSPDTEGWDSIHGFAVKALVGDPSGRIWIGTESGLFLAEPNTGALTHYRLDPGAEDADIRALLLDHQGVLWIGTYGAGLIRLLPENGETQSFRHDPSNPFSISGDRIESLYEDRGGVLWVATSGGGVNTLNLEPKPFHHLILSARENSNGVNNDISAIFEEPNGDLWIGTYGDGLRLLDKARGSYIHYRNNPEDPRSLSDNTVRAVLRDRRGMLWIATYSGGINRKLRDGLGFRHYRATREPGGGLSHDRVRRLYEDRSGRLWAGTENGLNQYDPNVDRFQWIYGAKAAGSTIVLSHPRILALWEDRRGMFWVGTEDGLNCIFAPESTNQIFRHQPGKQDSLSHNRIFSINEDREGGLWIGTNYGLNRYLPETGGFQRFFQDISPARNLILAILQDEAGFLWISSPAGLAKLDPSTGRFRCYDVHDGLQGNTFNFGAGYKSPSGEMFFGGTNGLNRFFPSEISDNPHVPPLAIVSIQVLNQEVTAIAGKNGIEELELLPGQNVCSLEFAALDYSSPEKNRYAYQLERFDKDWVEAGTRRFATYTNLDPGDYRFRVRGSNGDGVWNERGIEHWIRVVPPFWRTWWFLGLSALVRGGWSIGVCASWRAVRESWNSGWRNAPGLCAKPIPSCPKPRAI